MHGGPMTGTQRNLPLGNSAFFGTAAPGAFEDQIERLLRPLSGMRLRASLFAVRITSLEPEQTLALVHRELAHVGPSGTLRNGDAGMLYIGPRPPGPGGDRKLELWIAETLGWAGVYRRGNGIALEFDIVAVHRTLDEIASICELIDELTLLPSVAPPRAGQPLAAV